MGKLFLFPAQPPPAQTQPQRLQLYPYLRRNLNRPLKRYPYFPRRKMWILSFSHPPPFRYLPESSMRTKPRRGFVPQKRVLSKRTSRRFGMAANVRLDTKPASVALEGRGSLTLPPTSPSSQTSPLPQHTARRRPPPLRRAAPRRIRLRFLRSNPSAGAAPLHRFSSAA